MRRELRFLLEDHQRRSRTRIEHGKRRGETHDAPADEDHVDLSGSRRHAGKVA
jgi:hypothetical protein